MFIKNNPIIRINNINYELEGVPEYDPNVPDQEIYKSVLTGKLHKKLKGYYFEASITVPDYTESLYNTLVNAEVVTFFPYGDYSIDTRYQSPRFEAVLTEIKPFHLENKFYADALKISLRSLNYYKLEKYDSMG